MMSSLRRGTPVSSQGLRTVRRGQAILRGGSASTRTTKEIFKLMVTVRRARDVLSKIEAT
jgi:hypothetical protein